MSAGEAGIERAGTRRPSWIASAPANPRGALAAVVGILVAECTAAVVLGLLYAAVGHGRTPSVLARDIAGLVGLWIGFLGTAAYVASGRSFAAASPAPEVADAATGFRAVLGLSIRPIDVPIGIAVGVASQYALVPLLELPLLPFVPHLFSRLGEPARSLTAGESGAKLALLGVLLCVGSPIVEEIFFRGVLFRGLLGTTRDQMGWSAGAALAVSALLSGLVFGLVHFEALQLIALSGFGVVLALLSAWTKRLGAGIVAHMAFNTVTVLALVYGR